MKPERMGSPSLFSVEQERTMRADMRTIPDDYVPEVLPPSGEKLSVVVNKDHAAQVLDRLMAAYENDLPPYNDHERVRVPHDPRFMPASMPRGGIEHATFLFNTCYYMRGGIKSNEAVDRLARLYDQRPELFIAEIAAKAQPDDIISALKQSGLGFQETVAGQWIENSRRLTERYGGDPRRIFDGIDTYEASLGVVQNDRRGQGFVGFQEKMTSMIIYYLMDDGLIEPFKFPIPIDLHVMRVSIANQMITFPDAPNGTNLFTDETLAALRELYYDYAVERGVDPLRLCDAVWMLSESSCGRHPGNATLEPLGRTRRNGRKTYLIPGVVDPSSPVQQSAYASACGICPIEETCQFNIPGTHYYVGGSIIIRGKRMRFPISQFMAQSHQEYLF
ncbi:MAG TPA: hypothetical protein VFG56_00995 [Candidatus Saccharimonadales bacterium]|nr:hypothetical protein [Candidatus Saccharimonadales bacterium]